jgi:very-short-patch-repair endonuclease/DNA polymerase IIIc chi subunit
MTTIQFYHLLSTPLERALPKLLEKAFAGGFKTLLVADSDEHIEQLNQLLWTYDPNSFLPHGSVADGQAERQPILLVTGDYLQAHPPSSPASGGVSEASSSPAGGGGQGGGALQHGAIGQGEYSTRQPDAMAHAKELRKNPTEAENKIWYSLQKQNLGYRFRRQHPIGPYIVDFACLEKRLIVELDGGQHDQQQVYDEKRTAFLEGDGYKVLRFWNNEALGNTDAVLETIMMALGERGESPPSPPASGGVRTLLLITDGSQPPQPEGFERILDIFDGNDVQAVAKARQRWTAYKDAGHGLSYLKQTQTGGWEQKAVA